MSEPMSDLDRLVEDLEVYAEGCDCDICRMCLNAAVTITRLREALEPFAKSSDACDDPAQSDTMSAWETPQAMEVSIGDFRRARQALGGEHG